MDAYRLFLVLIQNLKFNDGSNCQVIWLQISILIMNALVSYLIEDDLMNEEVFGMCVYN